MLTSYAHNTPLLHMLTPPVLCSQHTLFYYAHNTPFTMLTTERLDGVNSTTRAVLKMENINFTYPGASKPQLTSVNVKLCLASRVAVLGE